ncbi:MAG: DUF6544 family protein [Cytophagaceae bacterium]
MFFLKFPNTLFRNELKNLKKCHNTCEATISLESIKTLPAPVQRYFQYCGYLGQAQANITEVVWAESKIKLAPGKTWTKLKTKQFIFVSAITRLALFHTHICVRNVWTQPLALYTYFFL